MPKAYGTRINFASNTIRVDPDQAYTSNTRQKASQEVPTQAGHLPFERRDFVKPSEPIFCESQDTILTRNIDRSRVVNG
jgi:hypothetical protein